MISVLQQMFAPMANTAAAIGNAESVAVYSDPIDISAPELTAAFSVLFDTNAPDIIGSIVPEMRVLSTGVVEMGAAPLIGAFGAGLPAQEPTQEADPKVQPEIWDEPESFTLAAVDVTAPFALPNLHLSAQVLSPSTEADVTPISVPESKSMLGAKLGPIAEIDAGQLPLAAFAVDQKIGARIAMRSTVAAKSDIPISLPQDVVRPDPNQTMPAAPIVINNAAVGARAELPRDPVITPPIDAKGAVANVARPDPMVPAPPQLVPQPVPQTAPQPVPQVAPQLVPQAAPLLVPQPVPPNLAQMQISPNPTLVGQIRPNLTRASLAESVFHTQIGAANLRVAEPVSATQSLLPKPSAILAALSAEPTLAKDDVKAEIIEVPVATLRKPILAPDLISPSPARSQLAPIDANIAPSDIVPADLVENKTPDLAADVQLWPVKPDVAPLQNVTQTPAPFALSSQTAPIAAQQFAAQILPQASAAKTGPIELVLNPAELGHLRFEIHQKGAHLEVVLLAERPETLELLRRHGDQLASEFRNAGFSGASLSFGHWDRRHDGQPPARFVANSQDDLSPVALPQQAKPQLRQGDARNLNLRL
jgi:flagellar hook-length control protein FliK